MLNLKKKKKHCRKEGKVTENKSFVLYVWSFTVRTLEHFLMYFVTFCLPMRGCPSGTQTVTLTVVSAIPFWLWPQKTKTFTNFTETIFSGATQRTKGAKAWCYVFASWKCVHFTNGPTWVVWNIVRWKRYFTWESSARRKRGQVMCTNAHPNHVGDVTLTVSSTADLRLRKPV